MGKLLFLLFMTSLFPKAMAQECIGSETAKHSVVYLHGMDTQEPSPQEMRNRRILKNLSQKLDLKITVPRATKRCPDEPSQICWGWDFKADEATKSTLEEIIVSTKKCFQQTEKTILLGFSNGGFVVNRIIQDCLNTPFSNFVSVAASGTWKTDIKNDLSRCGSLVLLIGQRDNSNYHSVKIYDSWLKQNKATTSLVEFPGGHELPEKELEQVLKSIIK